MMQIQTREEVMKLIVRSDEDCPAARYALREARHAPILGVWWGTWKYRGATVRRRIRAKFPQMKKITILSFGRCQGEDNFLVLGAPYQS